MAKKTIAAALGGMALAALVGSGVASADDATTMYLRDMRAQHVTGSDASLMLFGNMACQRLRMGSDLDSTALYMDSQFNFGAAMDGAGGYERHQRIVDLVNEARALCPETHRYRWEH